jgi:predicted RNase H-like nuclease (RuvC/YqgF family)
MDEDPFYQLVKEQLAHIQDQFASRITHLEEKLDHQSEMTKERTSALQETVKQLHVYLTDHETRIRSLTDSATSARTWQTLFTGGSLLASITALLRAFLGS